MQIQIESIFTGRPQSFPSEGDSKPWTSAIIKQRLDGPAPVYFSNIDGDQQADLVHHGGPDKAICAYAVSNYRIWRQEFSAIHWQNGCFGENLALSGVQEADVCIGDSYEVGTCILQVSQPRQPCWKLSRRWNLPKLPVRVQQTGRTGWYFRVLKEGLIESGQTLRLIDQPYPQWTVAAANAIMFAKPRNDNDDQLLAQCPLLSRSWQATLRNRSGMSEREIHRRDGKRLRE